MKTLNFDQMEILYGGIDWVNCSICVVAGIAAGAGFGAGLYELGACVFCLSSDDSESDDSSELFGGGSFGGGGAGGSW